MLFNLKASMHITNLIAHRLERIMWTPSGLAASPLEAGDMNMRIIRLTVNLRRDTRMGLSTSPSEPGLESHGDTFNTMIIILKECL